MEDEDLVQLNNMCADLVSKKSTESFPTQVLSGSRGEWASVRELCTQLGICADSIEEGLFVTWLSEPTGAEDYATIIFLDVESGWTMAATYNRARLLSGAGERTTAAAKHV